jgi:hypothetical protein
MTTPNTTKEKPTSITRKKTGWIIKQVGKNIFENKSERYVYTKQLKNASIFRTRKEARDSRMVPYETVCKVEFNGKDIQITAKNNRSL